jgi:hypothetical protein
MASIVVVAVTALTASVRPVLPTTATPVSAEIQVAHVVKICLVLLLSDNVPVAANCMVVPGAMLGGVRGVTSIDAT